MFKKILLPVSLAFFITSCNNAKVPNVVGQEASYARGIIKGQGFETEVIEKIEDGIQPGQVLSQEPIAEASIKKGSKIKLTITKPPVYELKGSVRLLDSEIQGTDDYCYGSGGYSDIKGGMSVTVRDGKGNILATGNTESGVRPPGEYSNIQCTFSFNVNNIPKTEFYSVEVGRRGQMNYSYEEMNKQKWELVLSLG
ncbi:PASTA domain-containing protein [Plectonema cf. radiosum LEGE 06105]|uniref:PASTA domain-containing protein n=1 Tax=Plectonema cf. radiosum LEGE 06105 TaxID=945769 RepID=A0A8J7JXK7_9CYAN|nr:PASTA domain-containing protein [Plectonema radiosum]MBE9216805.1 PASTA domain-containing protein [Plectonema cf. radiosum LEGE 06105]